jgi:hypothetical protein
MLPNEFVAASVAFDGILIAAITISVQVQEGQNKYLLKLGKQPQEHNLRHHANPGLGFANELHPLASY